MKENRQISGFLSSQPPLPPLPFFGRLLFVATLVRVQIKTDKYSVKIFRLIKHKFADCAKCPPQPAKQKDDKTKKYRERKKFDVISALKKWQTREREIEKDQFFASCCIDEDVWVCVRV